MAIAVHDLGGPVGLHWALHRPERVTSVALLNTLVYPEFSEAVLAFIRACTEPSMRKFTHEPGGTRGRHAARAGRRRRPLRGSARGSARAVRRRGVTRGARRRRDRPRARGLRRHRPPAALAARAGARRVRRAGPHPSRRRRDDGARAARRPARRGDGAARLRALPPGGGPQEIGELLAEFFAAPRRRPASRRRWSRSRPRRGRCRRERRPPRTRVARRARPPAGRCDLPPRPRTAHAGRC